MATAPLLNPSIVELPSVGKAAQAPTQAIEVIVNKDETLTLRHGGDTKPIRIDELAPNVLALQAPVTGEGEKPDARGRSAVVISADKNVKYEQVVKVMDTLQRAGVQRVGL